MEYDLLSQAADYVILMTYEWESIVGPPTAVAPISRVREVMNYGITQIPKSKILMGIPNYLAGISFSNIMSPFPAANILLSEMFSVVKVI